MQKRNRPRAPSAAVSRDESGSGVGVEGEAEGDRRRARELPGTWYVAVLYVTVIAIAAGTGYFLGVFQPAGLDPRLFGVIQLPPTPLGMAAYGAITLAVVLGLFFGGVAAVSRYYVDDGANAAGTADDASEGVDAREEGSSVDR